VLAIDAFSSDSIPVHLITREAMTTYIRHVKDDGIIAFHVTNRFLKLAPVVAEIAHEAGLVALRIQDNPDDDSFNNTDWVLVTRKLALLKDPAVEGATSPFDKIPGLRVWTDDYSALFQVLK